MPTHWHVASQLALARLCRRSYRNGTLRTRDSQFLHTKLEGGSLDPQAHSGTVRTREDPIRLFQDRQNMSSFDLFEGRKSIHLAAIRDAGLEIGRRNMAHRTSRENHCPFNEILHFTDVSRPGI